MPTSAAKSDLGTLPLWDLTALYPAIDSDVVTGDLDRALQESQAFEDRYKGKLAELLAQGGAALAEAIAAYEKLDELMGRLYSFAGLVYSENTTDPQRAKFFGDVQEKLTTASTHLVFFSLELTKLDDVALETGYGDPAFAYYKPWIDDTLREKPYQLDDKLEQLFHEKSVTGRAAWNRLFDETIASLRFDVDGENLTLEPTLSLLQDPDGAKRKAAAKALGATLEGELRTFTLITNVLAKDKEISDRWRGFGDVADSRHLANRVEGEVVEALVSAVQASFPRLSHRYYALKAKWMGVDALDYWDRNAPLPNADKRLIGWDEAKGLVLDAYQHFSPDMASIGQRFFDENWIDAPPREGKSPGAFSHPTVPSAHPYILLNYQGRTRDVMTLAHELGHGVHQVLAGAQGALMAQTPLTLAETASVFGEMLTFRSVLAATSDPVQRQSLLAGKVEDMINTVIRQIAFYSFERKVHEARRSGELTSEELCDLWLSVQHESLGDAVRFDDAYRPYWTYIGHFIHSPFYVYAYAFGDCLVNALYARYEDAHEGFTEHYLNLLKAGGSKPYNELLTPFGLDARDPQFWQAGLGVIEGFIDELETIDK
ncbi:MAG: M3 family oligoendopeptidase [Cohaesibacteraceae bacterium]